jgi:hypothetical protein
MTSMSKSLLPLLQLFSFSLATQQIFLGSNGTSPFDSKFAELVDETLDTWNVPGLSIAVVDGDDIWAEVSSSNSFCIRIFHPSSI